MDDDQARALPQPTPSQAPSPTATATPAPTPLPSAPPVGRPRWRRLAPRVATGVVLAACAGFVVLVLLALG